MGRIGCADRMEKMLRGHLVWPPMAGIRSCGSLFRISFPIVSAAGGSSPSCSCLWDVDMGQPNQLDEEPAVSSCPSWSLPEPRPVSERRKLLGGLETPSFGANGV